MSDFQEAMTHYIRALAQADRENPKLFIGKIEDFLSSFEDMDECAEPGYFVMREGDV
jgi:hypothetical protein